LIPEIRWKTRNGNRTLTKSNGLDQVKSQLLEMVANYLQERLNQEISNKEDLEIATFWVFLLPLQRIPKELKNCSILGKKQVVMLSTLPKTDRPSTLLLMTSSHVCISNQSFQVLTVKNFGFLFLKKPGQRFTELIKESKQDSLTMHSEIS
jgi:hypothetical protein